MVQFQVFKGSEHGIQTSITDKQIGHNEVLLRVTHAGVCFTDVHYQKADMVLGHEGVGVVEEIGKDVTQFKKGDRAAWGYLHNSCGHCKQCLTGTETLCSQAAIYGHADLDQGAFASHAIWNEAYLFAVPDAVDSADAAPLQCGGATVFNALYRHGVKPTDRVGVIGIGGLGHLAIQFAAKMGCEVVVFSSTEDKRDEAFKLGAKEFYATNGVSELRLERNLDCLLVTSSTQPSWDQYFAVMSPGSTIFPLTISNDELKLPYMPLLLKEIRLQGSIIAARQVQREMLQFAADHGIKPVIQEFPLTAAGVGDALAILENGKVRYRAVLVAQ